jgi:hypothetical protein
MLHVIFNLKITNQIIKNKLENSASQKLKHIMSIYKVFYKTIILCLTYILLNDIVDICLIVNLIN